MPVVLVVDDADEVLMVLGKMLTAGGFSPLLAACGRTGLETFRQHRGSITLAILDVQMPDMDGPAVLEALHELDPSLPCMFLTGSSGRYSEEELLERGAVLVMPKPISQGDLWAVVNACRKVVDALPENG